MALVSMRLDGPSVDIVKGRDYVNWRFQFSDEILIDVEGSDSKVLLAKLPDGRLRATADQSIIDSFTKVLDTSAFSMYGRTKH